MANWKYRDDGKGKGKGTENDLRTEGGKLGGEMQKGRA
jgi:hypothetical protein